MERSTQEREIKKFKRLVEKLRNNKKSLQRDNRNLKGRLSTTQSNSAKYRSAFKKKEKPGAGLDRETFEQLMNLPDNIITSV